MAQIENLVKFVFEEKNAPQHKSATKDLKEETVVLQNSTQAIDDNAKALKEEEKVNKAVNLIKSKIL